MKLAGINEICEFLRMTFFLPSWISEFNTSSISSMLNNLQWPPLDQRDIDNNLIIMYKVTYDLVAIPSAEYLIPGIRRDSKHNHPESESEYFTGDTSIDIH